MESCLTELWRIKKEAQTVHIQSHKFTSGTSCTCFHQKNTFPIHCTLMSKPEKFKFNEPGDVSAELFSSRRRCSHVLKHVHVTRQDCLSQWARITKVMNFVGNLLFGRMFASSYATCRASAIVFSCCINVLDTKRPWFQSQSRRTRKHSATSASQCLSWTGLHKRSGTKKLPSTN